jgi:uncharacterized protein YjbI with pentapeptide repeats
VSEESISSAYELTEAKYFMQTKDFKGKDLHGRSFKGLDLTAADFSDCDVRGVNF